MATIGTLVINIIGDSSQFRDSIEESIKTMQRAERQVARSARNIEKLGQGLMIGLTAPLMLISGYATKAAIDWEDAFAGVRKTVEGTEEQLAELARGIRDMAREIPTAAPELADIAAMAGQLGIQREAILGFTRTMADLAVATDLAGEQGATALAQFANVMQMSQRNFDRLGATIVALGNNSATTESRIAEFGQRIAAAGRIAGMAEAEVLAIGAAMASVGVEAEAGGTAVQKMLIAMTQAVAQGSDKLNVFAATAGMSAQEFATLWREDAAAAFTSFVEGLGRAGDQAFVILERLGMTDSRLTKAFLSLANAGDLLRRTVDLGNRAWEENTALAVEAAERYRTLASQLRINRNRLQEVAITLGESLAPVVESFLDLIQPIINGLHRLATAFYQAPPVIRRTVIAMGLLAVSIGPVLWGYSKVVTLSATLISAKRAMVNWVGKLVTAFAGLRAGTMTVGQALVGVFGRTGLIVGGILALASVAVYVAANWDRFAQVAARVWSGISAVVLYAAFLVVRGVGIIVSAMGAIVPALRPAGQAIRGWADSLKASAGAAMSSARTAAAVQEVADSAQATAEVGQRAAAAQEDLAESMEAAGKAATSNLQSFDQVHTIQEEMADSGLAGLDLSLADIAVPEIAMPGADMMAALGEQMQAAASTVSTAWQNASAAISGAWQRLLDQSPLLRSAVDGVNQAFDWIRQNWPSIQPVVEGIAGVLTLALVPALIRAGLEATIAGGKMVAAWAAAAAGAVVEGAKQIGQLIAVGARWAWMGVQAAVNAARMAAAWGVAMGPVGWVILAIAAVGAALVALWMTNEDFRNAVIAAWEWIKARAAVVWDGIRAGLAAVWGWISTAGPAAWAWLSAELLPLWQVARDAAVDIWGSLSETLLWLWGLLRDAGISIWTELSATLQPIWAGMRDTLILTWQLISTILQGIWQVMSAVAMAVWSALRAWWEDWGESVLAILSATWEQIKLTIETVINLIRDIIGVVLAVIRGDWEEAWTRVQSIAMTVWDFILGTAQNVAAVLAAVWQGVANTLQRLWDGIQSVALSVWRGIANGIIRFINGIIEGVNAMVRALNSIKIDVPDWVPVLGGKSFGFNLRTISTIPYLARGGNIVGTGLAVVGEAGAELLELPRGARVTPLSGGRSGALADEVGNAVYQAVRAAFREASTQQRQGTRQEITLQIDGRTFARLLLPLIDAETERQGFRFVRVQEV